MGETTLHTLHYDFFSENKEPLVFIIKEKKLYCTLMCKRFVTFHESNKKIKFYSFKE